MDEATMKMKLASDELGKGSSSGKANLLKIDEDFVHSHWLAWEKKSSIKISRN